MNNVFDSYYKKYNAWYDKNKFAYLSELEAVKKVLPRKGFGEGGFVVISGEKGLGNNISKIRQGEILNNEQVANQIGGMKLFQF